MPDGGIFRAHAVAAGGEHLPERNHVIFHNISGVNYGERCEGSKNDTERQLKRRLTDAPALFSAADSHRKTPPQYDAVGGGLCYS